MSQTIFIIDDNHEIITLMKYSLEHLPDVKLKSFANPSTALRRIEQSGIPDLIITDLKMAEMNGLEFLVHLRKINDQIPVIIFTGHAESLPPGSNWHTVFKDAHGFDRLVEKTEELLGTVQVAEEN